MLILTTFLLGSFFPALQLDKTAELKCHSAPRREEKGKERIRRTHQTAACEFLQQFNTTESWSLTD